MPTITDPTRSTSAQVMAGALAGMGALHFIAPKPFDGLIPPELPGEPRTWTLASGVVELTAAALIANPRTRHLGATLAAVLFVAVAPGNIQSVRDSKGQPLVKRVIVWARLPLQIPLIQWALRIRRDSAHSQPGALVNVHNARRRCQ